jgi:hypothetical protein
VCRAVRSIGPGPQADGRGVAMKILNRLPGGGLPPSFRLKSMIPRPPVGEMNPREQKPRTAASRDAKGGK